MTETIGKEELSRMFAAAAARIRGCHQQLSELDSVSGDGDHGSTMLRVVEKLQSSIEPGADEDWRSILRRAGWAVLGVDGGASSSLLGAFFSGMADAPCQAAELDCRGLSEVFAAGLGAASRHTKARPGDKTMMDALVPAIEALRAAADSGKPLAGALHDAAIAARAGAEATREMTARYGRARYLGEKTRGHQDPGAASAALLFEGFYLALAAEEGGSPYA